MFKKHNKTHQTVWMRIFPLAGECKVNSLDGLCSILPINTPLQTY